MTSCLRSKQRALKSGRDELMLIDKSTESPRYFCLQTRFGSENFGGVDFA